MFGVQCPGKGIAGVAVALVLLCMTASAQEKEIAPDVSAIRSLKAKSFVVPGMKKMRMILIEPGTFVMGSPESESGRGSTQRGRPRVRQSIPASGPSGH